MSSLSRSESSRHDLVFPPGTVMLIVEDENIVAWDIELVFQKLGVAEIHCAPNVTQARLLLNRHPAISIVLLDLRLGDESGAVLIDDLVAMGAAIVLTTGLDDDSGHKFPVVMKPYDYERLVHTVLEAVAKRTMG